MVFTSAAAHLAVLDEVSCGMTQPSPHPHTVTSKQPDDVGPLWNATLYQN